MFLRADGLTLRQSRRRPQNQGAGGEDGEEKSPEHHHLEQTPRPNL